MFNDLFIILYEESYKNLVIKFISLPSINKAEKFTVEFGRVK